MRVSLVVCTHNRCAQFAEALPYFSTLQSGVPFELIFVDNGSTDDTPALLEGFCSRDSNRARWVVEPQQGLSAARNRGLQEARGDIIAFTDDDCYPSPDFVQKIADCFEDPTVDYIGGRILLFDQDDLPVTIQTLEERVLLPAHGGFQAGLIHGANLAFRRSVKERVGLFDERLGAGTGCSSAEDWDYLMRASAHGFAGAYDPRPVVYHHHRRRTLDQVDRLQGGYDIGRGAFFAKVMTSKLLYRHFAKSVYWNLRSDAVRRDWGVLLREIRGAARFLASNRRVQAQPVFKRPRLAAPGLGRLIGNR